MDEQVVVIVTEYADERNRHAQCWSLELEDSRVFVG